MTMFEACKVITTSDSGLLNLKRNVVNSNNSERNMLMKIMIFGEISIIPSQLPTNIRRLSRNAGSSCRNIVIVVGVHLHYRKIKKAKTSHDVRLDLCN